MYYIYKSVGEHEVIKNKVAAKILLKSSIKSKDLEEKVKREIRYSKYFRHPNIIRLYEVIETNNEIILIMEYAAGGELYDVISKGRLNEEEGRRIFQQIIFGLEYIHAHQVTHRDLKPENILLDEDGNVKLADFGLSNVMRDGIFLYSSCGSPNYAAPELIIGKVYNGTSIDIWSSGVILYAMLTGTLPFDEDQIPKLYQKIKEGKYSLPPILSDSAKDLIVRMLQVNPLDRITIDEIKKHSWFVKDIKLYMQIDNYKYIYSIKINADEEIIKKMLSYGIDFNPTELKRAIESREKHENCVIYELLDNINQRKSLKDKAMLLDNEKNFFKLNILPQNHLNTLKKLRSKFLKRSSFKEKDKLHEFNLSINQSSINMNNNKNLQVNLGINTSMTSNINNSNNNSFISNYGSNNLIQDKNYFNLSQVNSNSLSNHIFQLPNQINNNQQGINFTNQNYNIQSDFLLSSNWRIGFICKKDCYYIILEILKCLENNGYEWKLVSSSYKIKCRKKDEYFNTNEKDLPNQNRTLNILIQVFSIPDVQEEYVIDLHRLTGMSMEFLDFCSNFLNGMILSGCYVKGS